MYAELVNDVRTTYASGRTRPVEYRRKQLKAMLLMVDENEQRIVESLQRDLRKSRFESLVYEVGVVRNEIVLFLRNLKTWCEAETPTKGVVNTLDVLKVRPEPYGVVLIIGTWNYPFALCLRPLIGALAAGNCVILKTSEVAPCAAAIIADLLPKYLDADCYKVVQGGPTESSQLLDQRFDYIFYTGSAAVGRTVRAKSNRFLTPVTLELGGKSPVYVDGTANLEFAAKRILWGKILNAGQTCIAPDYVICSEKIQLQLVAGFKKAASEFFPRGARYSEDYGRIINEHHFNRLVKYLNGGKAAAIGGNFDAADRFIEPTVLLNVRPDDDVMAEEIFGPILPILTMESPQSAIEYINSREKPLAVYIFSTKQSVVEEIISRTSSGGVCVNDDIAQYGCEECPFGGVGGSGMGVCGGRHSFDTFSHRKTCLHRGLSKLVETVSSVRYPPYNEKKLKFLQFALRSRKLTRRHGSYLRYLLVFATGFYVAYLYFFLDLQKKT